MEKNIIVTSGKRYIDIDAYASCIAYAKLLRLKGKNAKAISTANLNESITNSLIQLPEKLEKNYNLYGNEKFIILDVSNPNSFDEIVKDDQIIEIVDHHCGYEDYWKEKLKNNLHIEQIGSIATLIFEKYEKENMTHNISIGMAKLLLAAILDNTLDLKAKITTKRDIDAYKKLLKIAKVEFDFNEIYFKECQEKIQENIEDAVKNDTKIDIESCILPSIFSQLLLWDAKEILEDRRLYETLNSFGEKWMINLISIKDETSYIVSENNCVKKNLERLFHNTFDKNIMNLHQILLRKEIIKKALIS